MAQTPPSLKQGLTARLFQPLPHWQFSEEKLNLWVPAKEIFSSPGKENGRGWAQPPPSLEQGLTARPPQPLPHWRFRKEKLNLWVPSEAVFSSSPASTSFPPIWAQAASTLARSGGAPDASITQKVCPLVLLRAYVFTCRSHMNCDILWCFGMHLAGALRAAPDLMVACTD